jgi:predicted  nucleic acid-binding Zn-ribbon protein
MRKATEAQTAHAELAEERTRTSAKLAAIMLARLELGLARVFNSFCSGCHISSSQQLLAFSY